MTMNIQTLNNNIEQGKIAIEDMKTFFGAFSKDKDKKEFEDKYGVRWDSFYKVYRVALLVLSDAELLAKEVEVELPNGLTSVSGFTN